MLGESPALLIPAESVVIRDGRSYVLTLAEVSAMPKVSIRAVIVGRRQDDETEIVQGLSASDRVVVQGAGFLNDGDVVRLAASGRIDPPAAGQRASANK